MKVKKRSLTNAECCQRYQRKNNLTINGKRRERYKRMVAALKLVESNNEPKS